MAYAHTLFSDMTDEDRAIWRRFATEMYQPGVAWTDAAVIGELVARPTASMAVRASFGTSGAEFEQFCREVYGL